MIGGAAIEIEVVTDPNTKLPQVFIGLLDGWNKHCLDPCHPELERIGPVLRTRLRAGAAAA
jgi:hypothetical protein